MYDISTKDVSKGKNLFYFFLGFGIFFLIVFGGIIIASYAKLNSLDSQTTSTKVIVNSHIDDEGTTMYSPIYYYEVNGKEYVCSSSSSSSSYPGTGNKTVYYDSNNPEKCMSEYTKSSNKFLMIFLIIPIVFILVAVLNIRKVNKRVKIIKNLNKNGKLVKKLPYRLEDSNISVNGAPLQRLVVDYTLPNGSTVTLRGDPRNNHIISDADGMVDLVIDENNPDNYFIDLEINRLSGNLPTDYNTNQSQSINNNEPIQSNGQDQYVNSNTTIVEDNPSDNQI